MKQWSSEGAGSLVGFGVGACLSMLALTPDEKMAVFTLGAIIGLVGIVCAAICERQK